MLKEILSDLEKNRIETISFKYIYMTDDGWNLFFRSLNEKKTAVKKIRFSGINDLTKSLNVENSNSFIKYLLDHEKSKHLLHMDIAWNELDLKVVQNLLKTNHII